MGLLEESLRFYVLEFVRYFQFNPSDSLLDDIELWLVGAVCLDVDAVHSRHFLFQVEELHEDDFVVFLQLQAALFDFAHGLLIVFGDSLVFFAFL